MIKKNPIFIYPAVFKKDDDGYKVSFIDFCWPVEGKTLEEAIIKMQRKHYVSTYRDLALQKL